MRRYCKSTRRELLHEFSDSNLSIEDFCEQRQIDKEVIELAISESMEPFTQKELKLAPVTPNDFVEVKVINNQIDEFDDDVFTSIKSVDEENTSTSEEFLNLKIGNKAYLQIPLNLKKKKLVHILKAVAEI